MTAIPTKGTEFWLEAGTHNQSKNPIKPTAITKANPAVCTVAASTIIPGEVIWVEGTGFPELDNAYFIAGDETTATSVVLIGSNTTGSTGTLKATTAELHPFVENVDCYLLCPAQFSYDAGTAQNVAVATFCTPAATIPGTPTDGTATFSGYTDPTSAAYRQMMQATRDQNSRTIIIRVPGDTGAVVLEGIVTGYTEDYTIGNAISFTTTMALTRASRQLWLHAPTLPAVPTP